MQKDHLISRLTNKLRARLKSSCNKNNKDSQIMNMSQ